MLDPGSVPMSPFRLLIAAVASFCLSGCAAAREDRAPTVDELLELSLEELLEVPIERASGSHARRQSGKPTPAAVLGELPSGGRASQ